MAEAASWRVNDVFAALDAPAYRGPDRRAVAVAAAATRRSGSGRVALYLVATNIVVLGVALSTSASYATQDGASDWLTASVAVVAALAAAIEIMRWRLVGDAPALWVGAALLVYSAANIAFPGLLRSFGGTGAQSWDDLVRPASVFVVIAMLATAASRPAIDATLRPRRVVLALAGIAVAGLAASSLSPTVRLVLGPPIDSSLAGGTAAVGQVGVAVAWLALGVAFLFGPPTRDDVRPWIGVMLLGLAEARLGLAMSVTHDSSWLLASQLFRLFGMAAVLGGTVHGLHHAFARQRVQLLDSLTELSSARAQQRAEHATAEERAHDLKAALVGIGSAAVTLERYHVQISDEERASLTSALAAEIARLQHFVAAPRSMSAPFAVDRALEPLLRCATSQGMALDVHVDEGVTAIGRSSEVVGAVQNLLDNAWRHAPGSPVTVTVARRGAHVVVRIEDRGPGVPVADHHRVFERGWRGDTGSEGSGLGLCVASRLVRSQGGELWVEDRPEGGASFVLSLWAHVGSAR